MGGHKLNVVSADVADVDSIEVQRTEQDRQWIRVGLVSIAGGLLLGLMSLLFFSSPLSPLLMAVSLILIGAVFILTYIGGLTGQVVMRAGAKDIKCRMRPKSLDSMVVFVQRFYELKLGFGSGSVSYTDDSDLTAGSDGDANGSTSTRAYGSTSET